MPSCNLFPVGRRNMAFLRKRIDGTRNFNFITSKKLRLYNLRAVSSTPHSPVKKGVVKPLLKQNNTGVETGVTHRNSERWIPCLLRSDPATRSRRMWYARHVPTKIPSITIRHRQAQGYSTSVRCIWRWLNKSEPAPNHGKWQPSIRANWSEYLSYSWTIASEIIVTDKKQKGSDVFISRDTI